jgi:hypothetical protein
MDVIDGLLRAPVAVSGADVDELLELRWQLRQRVDSEGTLRIFCDLRRRLEQKHYLAFFRIRRWLENHLHAIVRPSSEAKAEIVPLKLDHYCVEAIRRDCLCAASERGPDPRVQFAFNEPPSTTITTSTVMHCVE